MKGGRMTDKTRMLWVVWLAATMTACGGGGAEDAPVISQPNRNPEAGQVIGNLRANAGLPADLDFTAGGAAARDPDSDTLIYMPEWVSSPPPGLHVSGQRIIGTATAAGIFALRVNVLDGKGGEFRYTIDITVMQNTAPPVLATIPLRLATVGESVDIDALQGGATFGPDPQNDGVTFSVSLSPNPRGLTVSGSRVTGVFASLGAVRARITATDVFGASSYMDFVVVSPGPEPPRPVLPAVSHTYDPYRLALPSLMMPGLAGGGPLGDTTPASNPTTDAGATLGRVLFYDRRLSSTNTHACASCHKQSRGFADDVAFSIGAAGDRSRRNAMSLTNVQFNPDNLFFSDRRVSSLERLVLLPIEDATELSSSLAIVVPKLAATDFYPPLFQAAFGTSEVTSQRIGMALAQFLRALKSYRSPFDSVHNPLAGRDSAPLDSAFSPQALEGRAIFSDQSCSSCHRDVLQHMTRPSSNGLDVVPPDPGAGEGRFRSASLRNIQHSGPYMHDGRFATLREVIDHYDHGMKSVDSSTTALWDGTNPTPRRMNFTEAQKLALEAFLNTFTDQEFLADPRFSDPFP
jgi:cytochrome c peroxidase